jgi:putative DNA primase/helicase
MIDVSKIPERLKAHKNFVVWRREQRGDKTTKVPYSPKTWVAASTTNPDDWADLDDAITAKAAGNFDGIGFVFDEAAGIVGIDLDHCILAGENGNSTLTDFAEDIVMTMNSYTEVSPSKTGLHILVEATYIGKGIKRSEIEIYGNERYFTLTGNVIVARLSTIENRQDEVNSLIAGYEKGSSTPAVAIGAVNLSHDEDLVRRYCEDEYRERLWVHKARHPSQSEYDMAIASTAMHAGFTKKEAAALIYHNRVLHDENPDKAKRTSYIEDTISKAALSTKYVREAEAEKIVETNSLLFAAKDVVSTPKKISWLIKNYIPTHGIIWIAGEWSTKKTFLALNMAAHIAAGKPWCGNKTKQSDVVYITGEGHSGMGKRLKAIQIETGIHYADNFWLTEKPIMLNDLLDFATLLRTIKQWVPNCAAIFIDTKSANMKGNDADGGVMNDWVNVVRSLELDVGCIVIVIDHVGHMEKGRPRGSSVQMGAADAVYMVTCDKNLSPDKILFQTQKDPKEFRTPKPLTFNAKEIVLPQEWNDEDGDPVTSLCLVESSEPFKPVAQEPKQGSHATLAYDILVGMYEDYKANLLGANLNPAGSLVEARHWQQECLAQGITGNNFRRIKKRLLDRGVITHEGVHIQFTEDYK